MSKMLASEVLASALAVARNGTSYTDSVPFRGADGTAAAVIAATTAGEITITQQCSPDGATWYDPVNTSGSALGAVAASFTVGSRYVQYTLVPAPFVRFKIVEAIVAATAVTLRLIYREDV